MITISAGHEEANVVITIADSGRGIAPGDLPHIFEKFYRGEGAGGMHPSAEEVPGIGLGLNLALSLVQGMGGRIDVESQLGEGSRFVVRLPIWDEETASTNNPQPTPNDHAKTVLLAGTTGRR